MRRREMRTSAAIGLGLSLGLLYGCAPLEHDTNKWLTSDAGGKGKEDSGSIKVPVDTDDDTDETPTTDDSKPEPEDAGNEGPIDSGKPSPKPEPTGPAQPEPEPAPKEDAGGPAPVVDSGTVIPPVVDSGPEPVVDSGPTTPVDSGPSCVPVSSGEATCDDSIDDDCDGMIDCDDSDCRGVLACCVPSGETESVCGDSVDDDCDGKVDCADPDCVDTLLCCIPSGATELLCDDAKDDDCDGTRDCDDSDCSADLSCRPACEPTGATETDCSDGNDDDCDTLIDCADVADCGSATECLPACQPSGDTETTCDDSKDDDCDGFVDCDDSDCGGAAACQTSCVPVSEDCTDGSDNDCDGFSDCTDSQCAPTAACCTASGGEICTDGIDNNCDGVIDCPVITATVPERPPAGRETWEGGAVSPSAARIMLQAPIQTNYIVQCRSGKPATVSSKVFVACNPTSPASLTVQPFPDGEASNPAYNGIIETQVRFAFPNSQVSQPASFRYYVHNSLAGAQPCPRKAPDADLFAAARPNLVTATSPKFLDSDAKLMAPFVNIAFKPSQNVEFGVGAGEGDVEYLSLRRRFSLSPEKDLILMRRAYTARRNYSPPCRAATIFKHNTDDGIYGINSARHYRTGCDALVMNKQGAGVCLIVDNQGTIKIANPQSAAWQFWNFEWWAWVDWETADNFMWRKLLVTQYDGTFRAFSPKCYAGGSSCVGTDTDVLFLPDRGLFPW